VYYSLKEKQGAGLHEWTLLEWLLQIDGAGDGKLRRSYAQLADRLWCSTSKARSTVKRLADWRLIQIEEQHGAHQQRRENALSIDWDGVRKRRSSEEPRSALAVETAPAQTIANRGETGGVSPEHPPVSTAQGGVAAEHPPVSTEHPYQESGNSGMHSLNTTSPDPAPERREFFPSEIPELSDLVGRRVRRGAAGRLTSDVFTALTITHLRSPVRLASWWAAQLASQRPVTGCELWELVCVLALARFVLDPNSNSQRPVARFVKILSQRMWGFGRLHFRAARQSLDEMLASDAKAAERLRATE